MSSAITESTGVRMARGTPSDGAPPSARPRAQDCGTRHSPPLLHPTTTPFHWDSFAQSASIHVPHLFALGKLASGCFLVWAREMVIT